FIPSVIKIVNERQLKDKPGKHKIHTKEIPTLGGIAIFGGFAFGYLLGVDDHMQGASYVTAAALMLFFTGLKDDLINLSPWKKITAEVGAALIIALFTDLRFTSFHGLAGIGNVPAWVSYIVTVVLVVIIINSFNLIDGIDGLAASLGIIASVVFGTWFWLSGDYGYAIMAAALAGSLVIFIRFNLSDGPGKIFMGDSGSLVIGFIMAVFAIRFNEIIAAGKGFITLDSAPSVSIGILIIPLFDTFRIIILRLANHQSLLEADQRHTHHMMLRAGFTHLQATVLMSLFNIFIIAVAFIFDGLGILWLGLLILILCGVTSGILARAVKRKESGLAEAGSA
ncbi:MAG: undecaprenyl/decaprenyl-phosphate alpha-N-acetylglucosaminyl 1-phosphate transferase, partial [Bacteroidia bacterium]